MKKKGNRAFTLVELIAVVAILSILLCIAVPNMMNYINAAHEATAQTEARICVDAVQRYLNDEKEKGKLTGGMLLRLMGLDLSNSDGPLKDYISGGQKGARICLLYTSPPTSVPSICWKELMRTETSGPRWKIWL